MSKQESRDTVLSPGIDFGSANKGYGCGNIENEVLPHPKPYVGKTSISEVYGGAPLIEYKLV
jgi:hypothetical protein